MKKTLIIILPVLIAAGCGDNNTTEPPAPQEISVVVNPTRILLDVGEATSFIAYVYGTANRAVTWTVEDMPGGSDEYGTINEEGRYYAPNLEPAIDSIRVAAVSVADTTKKGIGWVIIVDPTKVYVSPTGDDDTGIGSKQRPYRTITFALTQAVSMQSVVIRPGTYSVQTGEIFPLQVGGGIVVSGAGRDSTFVIGPGGGFSQQSSVFNLNSDAITIEKMTISTADGNGVGIWMLVGILVRINSNFIGPNHTGIVTMGGNFTRPIIESNIISGDSVGVATGENSEVILRNNQITNCGSMGVHIYDTSRPDLGTNDSTDAGGNTIQNCGQNNLWLIRNDSPDSIWAVGNTWVNPNPVDNDQFIYDDDENPSSGVVYLINQ